MLKRDGSFIFYTLEVQSAGTWIIPNLDYYGYPTEFGAEGQTCQLIGVHGTFTLSVAYEGLRWMQKRHPETAFRILENRVDQERKPLSPPVWEPEGDDLFFVPRSNQIFRFAYMKQRKDGTPIYYGWTFGSESERGFPLEEIAPAELTNRNPK